MLLRAKSWFGRQLHSLKLFEWGFDPRYAASLGRFWMLLRLGSCCGGQFHVCKPFDVSILGGFGCFWSLKADLDDSGTVWSCLSGGFDPRYAESLGRFWMLLRVGSYCEGQFHVCKLLGVSILGGFGCSWRLKADLDDSFTFWSRFMLAFWDDFGCFWGLKADFDNSFTFLSRFILVFSDDFGCSCRRKADLDDSFTFLS